MTNRLFWVAVSIFSLIMLLTMWLSSGSLTPYAATYPGSMVDNCGYLVSVDHEHFKATFDILDGTPFFKESVNMRRMLQPIYAYPFMKIWGYMEGGFVSTLILYLITLILFAHFLSKKLGQSAALVGVMLFSTYPGIHYYAGLPYSHISIVPVTIFSMMILWSIMAENSIKRILLYALLEGVLLTAYDLIPFFGLAFCMVLLARKKYLLLLPSILLLIFPQVLVLVWLHYKGSALVNASSGLYSIILSSYFKKPDFNKWFSLLIKLPSIVTDTYLYSGFLFLPLLFLFHLVLAFKYKKRIFSGVEAFIILSIGAVFFFNNLAPPYEAFPMRGSVIVRLYQPIFIVYILAATRLFVEIKDLNSKLKRMFMVSCLVAFLMNTVVVIGPVMGFGYHSSFLYYSFYKHKPNNTVPPTQLLISAVKYGRVPIGICRDNGKVASRVDSTK